MLKITCGVDIIEIDRIKKAIQGSEGAKFIEIIYTENEIKYCESHLNNKYQHYAARFAAKEATFKALSKISKEKSVNWNQIEITNNETGKPEINLENDQIQSIDVSISHCKDYAVANVVILYTEK